MLKAVIFDLDGVITDSARFHYIAWKGLADELSIDFDERYNEKLKGVSRMESLNLILENGGLKESYTMEEKCSMADKKNDRYKELICKITPSDVLPGILDFLKNLKASGIKTAVASVSQNVFFIIDRLKLTDYFDYIVDPGDVERAKPFPDIFLAGAKAVDVLPGDCVGIEDAKAGIEAINAAGMRSVGVGTKDQMKEAELVLENTKQLSLELIKKTFGM